MKPQNILVTQFDEPALADFGVAALRASAPATGGVFGFTTLHASPEILEGRELSPATDVYGLGSTLYELLTGKAPFAAFDGEAPASVILRILSQPVAPLRHADIPLGLSDLLEASLAKSAADRPPSAAVLAESLRRIEAECGWTSTPYVVVGNRPAAQSVRPDAPYRPPVAVSSPVPPVLSDSATPSPTAVQGQPTPVPPRLAAVRGDRNSLAAPVPAARKVATPKRTTREDVTAGLGPPSPSPAPRGTPPARGIPAPPAAARPIFAAPPPAPPTTPVPPTGEPLPTAIHLERPGLASPPPPPPATRPPQTPEMTAAAILPPPSVAPPPAAPAPVGTAPSNRGPFRRRKPQEPPG